MSDTTPPASSPETNPATQSQFNATDFGQSVLCNVSQVVLQNNSISGALILVALFWHSTYFGLAAVFGSVISSLTALVLGADKGAIRAGLHGFNGVLAAIAVVFYCTTQFTTLKISVVTLAFYSGIAALFSTIIGAALGNITTRWGVPPLTAPFVLASWIFVAGTQYSPALTPGSVTPLGTKGISHQIDKITEKAKEEIASSDDDKDEKESIQEKVQDEIEDAVEEFVEHAFTASTYFEGVGKGFGEVFFEDNYISGFIILLAIFVNSPFSGLMAILGALISIAVANILGVDSLDVHMGMYSYSAILTAIALGGLFIAPSLLGICYMILGVIVTTWMFPAFAVVCKTFHLSAYTTPFIVATWIMLFGATAFKNLVVVPLSEASKPENHFRYLRNRAS